MTLEDLEEVKLIIDDIDILIGDLKSFCIACNCFNDCYSYDTDKLAHNLNLIDCADNLLSILCDKSTLLWDTLKKKTT